MMILLFDEVEKPALLLIAEGSVGWEEDTTLRLIKGRKDDNKFCRLKRHSQISYTPPACRLQGYLMPNSASAYDAAHSDSTNATILTEGGQPLIVDLNQMKKWKYSYRFRTRLNNGIRCLRLLLLSTPIPTATSLLRHLGGTLLQRRQPYGFGTGGVSWPPGSTT